MGADMLHVAGQGQTQRQLVCQNYESLISVFVFCPQIMQNMSGG